MDRRDNMAKEAEIGVMCLQCLKQKKDKEGIEPLEVLWPC